MREALDDAEQVVKVALDLGEEERGAKPAAETPAAATKTKTAPRPATSRRAQAALLFSKTLLGRSPEDLRALAVSHGQPAYRGDQLYSAITSDKDGGARNLAGVRVLPKAWRERLEGEGWTVGRPVVSHEAVAPDGTRKLLLRLADGHEIETVGIPVDGDDGDDGMSSGGGGGGEDGSGGAAGGGGKSAAKRPTPHQSSRLTCCVSTMAGGCPLRCAFCATGKSAFARNLAPHEILAQAMATRDAFGGRRVSRVVFMGGGEPLVNLPSVLEAVALLRRDLGLSGRAITISTVGVPNTIQRLAGARLAATLAVSLHAPNQALREKLVPSAKVYPLDALMQDCADYFRTTGRRVTFEYTLMSGENDSDEHARELAALLRRHGMLSAAASAAGGSSFGSSGGSASPSVAAWGGAHVNLIPYNSVEGGAFSRPSRGRVFDVRRALEAAAGRSLSVSVRATRGEEANAACGQLAYKANSVGAVAGKR
jgi:23S rRNA (adenine2503-C2)-methyltransferase